MKNQFVNNVSLDFIGKTTPSNDELQLLDYHFPNNPTTKRRFTDGTDNGR